MRTVAVDAMGGDHAPAPEVEGAVAAVRERIARVVLVGDEARVRGELVRLGADGLDGLTVRHASEVIRMEDHPAVAAKGKKDSSMRVAFDLAKEGKVDAVVSAGNWGAMLACGLFVMRRLAGVERPGIVTTFPTVNGVCALIDMGANVECRPETLAQFAVLGAVYARLLHGKTRPKVGLLSNGEEAIKGTELTRGAHKLLSAPATRTSSSPATSRGATSSAARSTSWSPTASPATSCSRRRGRGGGHQRHHPPRDHGHDARQARRAAPQADLRPAQAHARRATSTAARRSSVSTASRCSRTARPRRAPSRTAFASRPASATRRCPKQ